MTYLRGYGTKVPTKQTERAYGRTDQVQNNAGGYVFQVDDFERAERWLILGSEGNTFYVKQQEFTRQNAQCIERCIAKDGQRLVQLVADISTRGRAPKNDPALFALAMAISLGDMNTRQLAAATLVKVARTGTHLSHFVQYATQFRGWGKTLRAAVKFWFMNKGSEAVLFQAIKYNQRDGWSMRDFLRLSHPKVLGPDMNSVFKYIVKGEIPETQLFTQVRAIQQLSANQSVVESARLIREHRIPRECVPTELLKESQIWQALLQDMPMTAMVRSLAVMTRNGALKPTDFQTINLICDRLRNQERIHRARLHPLAFLVALNTYDSGVSMHGKKMQTWEPIQDISDALNDAFYLAFESIQPIGNRVLIGVDVSGSMSSGTIAGLPGITPRQGAAALAMQIKKTERDAYVMGFQGDARTAWGWSRTANSQNDSLKGFVPLKISPNMRLDQITNLIGSLPFGPTDCAVPFLWATENKAEIDTFITITDNETWAGDIHPYQAIESYRSKFVRNAKFVAIAMTATDYSVADPKDMNSMNVVGFDAGAPVVITNFASNKATSVLESEDDQNSD